MTAEGTDPMLHTIWALALGLLLVSQYAFAQTGQTGNVEAICSTAAVVLCENFEDRTINDNTSLFTNLYKNSAWGVSQPGCTGNGCSSVRATPSGAPAFLGSKVMRFVTPANQASGGFFDHPLPASNEYYVRMYTMWCGPPLCATTYIWSPVATKHVSFENEASTESALWWFCGSNCGLTAPAEMRQFWYNTFNGPGEAGQGGAGTNERQQNINGTQRVSLNTWYCLELHVKMNSTSSAHDGLMEGWIDGVQHWNYQNQLISQSPTPNRITGWGWFSYWNCDASENCSQSQYNHPEIYRYEDNLIVSTQRIGCLGAGTPPAAPTSLQVR